MKLDAHSDPIRDPQGKSGTRAKTTRRFQFSLSALMLAVLAIAVVCATLRWLGSVWFIPLVLAVMGTASLMMAVRHGPSWRHLKLGYWHLVILLALGTAASGLTVAACLDYNAIAGTDKTPTHIVQISSAVLAGPMVGPVANSAAGETPQARRWTAILFTILILAASPFVIVRRGVPWAIALIAWTGFIAAVILWFFGAMISLGVFLS